MKEILRKPLIGYLFERLSYSKRIDRIVLATSLGKDNDMLCQYIASQRFAVYRGSEEDVLNRFYEAAGKYHPKVKGRPFGSSPRQRRGTASSPPRQGGVASDAVIVRVTGDSPLIDPVVCDGLIDFYLKGKADYACLSQRFAEGVDCEVFAYEALVAAYKNAQLKSEREHVTPYIYNHPELFQKAVMENTTDDSRYRFTVDEPEDFDTVKEIIQALYRQGAEPFTVEEIKKFIDAHPGSGRKNAHIVRNEGYSKSLREDGAAEP